MKDKRLGNNLTLKDGLCVELETNKGENHYHEGVKLTCSYRGLLSVADFNRIIDNPSDAGFVKLERVYWIEEEELEGKKFSIWPVRFGHDDDYKNFLGPLFLRISQIVAIAPIDGGKDMKWIKAAVRNNQWSAGTPRPL